MNMFAVVMAGGQGTRFWPESTAKKPKQYLSLTGEQSLLRQSLERFNGLVAADKRYVVTVKGQAELAQTHAKDAIAKNGLIFEPAGRNTAPCILLALAALLEDGAGEDDVICIVPADHVILNEAGFRETVEVAAKASVEQKKIVTIGIVPNFPHTGYGYIQKGAAVGDAFNVEQFKEKPDSATAKEYVASGKYLWNAGMFVAPLGIFLREFQACSPETFESFAPLKNAIKEKNEAKLSEVYSKMPKDSIDYAVMEKSKHVSVVPSRFDWNDLGSWDALESVMEASDGNIIASANRVIAHEARGNIVFTPGKTAALIGVDDLIIVSNEHSVLVAPKSRSQDVKKIVEKL
ncbi:MAG: mannose-1-phosphate guanylyltransferase [bacterium]